MKILTAIFLTMHPYELRRKIRQRLPWFLIRSGIASKGKNCESVGASHWWYNIDDRYSGCYYCNVIKEGQLWKKEPR